jgi:hypothetical protein
MPDEGRCQTCKWWGYSVSGMVPPERGDGKQRCHLITFTPVPEGRMTWMQPVRGECNVTFETDARFGCVLWEGKTDAGT